MLAGKWLPDPRAKLTVLHRQASITLQFFNLLPMLTAPENAASQTLEAAVTLTLRFTIAITCTNMSKIVEIKPNNV